MKLLRKLRALFRNEKLDTEMAEEMRTHLEFQAAANLRAGMSADEAHYVAQRQFGHFDSIRETSRDQRALIWLDQTWQDLRYGARALRSSPGFTVAVVLTLALGIGATTAIFSVVHAVLLRPLPYSQSERLMGLTESSPSALGASIAYPNFADWHAQQTVFENLGACREETFVVSGDGQPIRTLGVQASREFFAALGVQPELGRLFTVDEDESGGPPVVLLSHAFWQNRFGGDPNIVQKTITVNGRAHNVVGVLPAGKGFPSTADLWVPIGPCFEYWRDRNEHNGIYAFARLKPGVTREQARTQLNAIAANLEQQYPDTNKNHRVRVEEMLKIVAGDGSRALWTLFGAVGLVLLIACANVANLLLARSAARQRETAVRAAVGASRWRIVRQHLAESTLLAVSGAVAGLLLAQLTLHTIVAWSQSSLPRVTEATLDAPVLLFSAGVAMLTSIVCGLAPAWRASHVDLREAMQRTSAGTTNRLGTLRHGLVVAQVALTLMLLAGAGLLLRSYWNLEQVDPGFSTEHLLRFRLALNSPKYYGLESPVAFYRALLDRLRALPGVEAASIGSRVPLDDDGWVTPFLVEGQREGAPGDRQELQLESVEPDYFRTLGIPLLRGRVFTEHDNREHLRGSGREKDRNAGLNSVIVDEEFARRYWPNQDPIGRSVRLLWGAHAQNPVLTVVGVVGRVKLASLAESNDLVQAYLPLTQSGDSELSVILKTRLAPETIVASARKEMRALDPDQPIFDVRPFSELRTESEAPLRLNLKLLGAFASVALALAALGLYSILAYGVVQRQREIGVRMALGGQRSEILQMILRGGMKLTSLGLMIGLTGALALTRVLRSLLFGVSPTDPLVLLAVVTVLSIVALLACYLPARRATKVDPTVALRCE